MTLLFGDALMWLNVVNAALGIVTLLFVLLVAWEVVAEIAYRQVARHHH